jgi:hypothetical protein
MATRVVFTLFCLFAVTACGDTPSSPSPIAQEVVLAPGQSADIQNAGISLRFDGVSGDSRCPGDAICIQGGDALVKVSVLASQGRASEYVLHTGDMRPANHQDLTIALLELSPYPFSSLGPIAPKDYRAKLKVTR